MNSLKKQKISAFNRRRSQMRFQMSAALAVLMMMMWFPASSVSASDAKEKFYRAEICVKDLEKSEKRQKYRENWLKCIDKYMSVYKHDPKGPWAAAGLYNAGVLYLKLHKISYRGSDRQAGIDAFQKIVANYPKSRYYKRAKKELTPFRKTRKTSLKKKIDADTQKLFADAQAAYERLRRNPKHQKYRDKWIAVITKFERAYNADPQGSLAPGALFMTGELYGELFKRSLKTDDKEQSQTLFRQVVSSFPDSTYRKKAQKALEVESAYGYTASANTGVNVSKTESSQNKADLSDAISQVIEKHKREADTSTSGSSSVSGYSGLSRVSGLRFWSNPRYTRVVIDAEQETTFSYGLLRKDPSLKKPRRLFIDLDKSRLSKDIQRLIPINDDLLMDARAGQYTKDKVRVVVDIKSFKTYKIFPLKNPFRIVIDVWGRDNGEGDAPIIATPDTGRDEKPSAGSIARQLALGVSTIVIDPGHGGKDYGAPGYLKGVHEKDIVLKIAKRLADKIKKTLGCNVVMTRSTDKYLSLEERTAIANTQNADLFISIHTNAVVDKRVYGIETFFLNLATDDEAIMVAARENATSTKNISDLQSILNDLMQNAKINESSRLAGHVHQTLYGHMNSKYSKIRNKGVKQAPFYVLMGAQMPAILIETSFISNPRECKRLTNRDYQDRLCDGIIEGIKTYIKELNPTALNRVQTKSRAKG